MAITTESVCSVISITYKGKPLGSGWPLLYAMTVLHTVTAAGTGHSGVRYCAMIDHFTFTVLVLGLVYGMPDSFSHAFSRFRQSSQRGLLTLIVM